MTQLDLNDAQQQLGLTRAEMARAMGVYYYTLAKWQNYGTPGGQKPPAAAVTLARVLLWLHGRGLLPAWIDFMGRIRGTDDDRNSQ